jgi:hypothetical protein
MKLRSVSISKRLIPEWNENKNLPPGEQVIVNFTRIPGASEKGNYKSFEFGSTGGVKLSYNDTMMLTSFVGKIENLEIDDGEKIKNGKDLAAVTNPEIAGLITEIRDYLFPDTEDLTSGESSA